jgi:hypothetical protein
MGGSDAGILSGGGALNAALGSQSNTAATSVTGNTAGSLAVSVTSASMDGPSTNTTSNPGVGQNHGGPDHIHNNMVSHGATSGALSVFASGMSGAFSVVQPTRILNYLIRI